MLDHAHRQSTLRGGARRRIHDGVDFVGFGFPMQKKRRWLLYHDWEGLLQLKMCFSCLPLGIFVALHYQSSLIKREKRTPEEEKRAARFADMQKCFKTRRHFQIPACDIFKKKMVELCNAAGVNPVGPHVLERDAPKFGVALGQQIIVLSAEEIHYRFPEEYDPTLPSLFLFTRPTSVEEKNFLSPTLVDFHINAVRDLTQLYHANSFICLFCGHSTQTNNYPHSCRKHKVCLSCHRPTENRALKFWTLPPLQSDSFYCCEVDGTKRIMVCATCNLIFGQGDCETRHNKFKRSGVCHFYRCLKCEVIW